MDGEASVILVWFNRSGGSVCSVDLKKIPLSEYNHILMNPANSQQIVLTLENFNSVT